MNNISLTQVLSEMEGKRPFQVKFVKLNRDKNTGGKIIELKNATKVGAKFNLKDNDMINIKRVDNNDHPYPVHIHLITEFNGKNVFI